MRFLARWRKPAFVSYGLLAFAMLGEILAIHARTGSFVFFTLDDAYIHLALAERVAHGFYGINSGEFASPSSSIVYPLLLAPLARAGFGELSALTLNIGAGFGILFVWRRLFSRFGFDVARWENAALALLATFAVNGVALAFTGMEHTLHVLCTLLTVLALVDVVEDRPTPWFLHAAVVAGALLRYEGAAVAGAAALVLILYGRWRQAVLLISVVAVFYGGFSLFLHALGLPFLPNSVLAKSDSALVAMRQLGGKAFFHSLASHVVRYFSLAHALMATMALYAGIVAYRRRSEPGWQSRLGLILFGSIVLAVHFVAFRSGWFFRYEPYAVSVLLSCIGYVLFSGGASPLGFPGRNGQAAWAGMTVCLVVFMVFYSAAVFRAPGGARNIYEQQYQMHRFATEFWHAPVAVNDVGWVAYRNPDYVLDIAGLATPQAALEPLRSGRTKGYGDFIAAHHIGLAMIYKPLEFLIGSRMEIARLHLGGRRVTAAGDTVSFYVTDEAYRDRAEAALNEFAKTLPVGVTLERLPSPN